MEMKSKTIQNINDLKYHKQLLEVQLKHKEQELGHSLQYFRKHYKSMIWREINPLRNNNVLDEALHLITPGLIPVVVDLVKNNSEGKPFSVKQLSSSFKYAIASLGIKWLRKWLRAEDIKPNEDESLNETIIKDEATT
jgi:hypothetical protein